MDDKNKDCGSGCGSSGEKHIHGVSCDVTNCYYHDGKSYCTAGEISVGPSHATSSTDTACVTFKKKG